MRLVQRGDARAFEAIYDRHGSAAFSLAYRIAGNRSQAEDIVQEAFLSVWRSSVRYQPERGNLRSWLLSVDAEGIEDRKAAPAGFTHTQIAELLEMPLGTLKGNRAIDALRRSVVHARHQVDQEAQTVRSAMEGRCWSGTWRSARTAAPRSMSCGRSPLRSRARCRTSIRRRRSRRA